MSKFLIIDITNSRVLLGVLAKSKLAAIQYYTRTKGYDRFARAIAN